MSVCARAGRAKEVGRAEADAHPGVPAGALHPGIRATAQGPPRGRGGGARGRERAARSLGDHSRAHAPSRCTPRGVGGQGVRLHEEMRAEVAAESPSPTPRTRSPTTRSSPRASRPTVRTASALLKDMTAVGAEVGADARADGIGVKDGSRG